MKSIQKKLVIVGNGMATGRLLDELAKSESHPFQIIVIGDEVHGSYNRIMLSSVLAGEVEKHTIIQKDHDWFARNHVTLRSGIRVTELDTSNKYITLSDNTVQAYDHLVIASGSRPAKIPAKNQHLRNIYSFRTLDDVDSIAAVASEKSAVVVGGGLLGLEAAYGLAKRGVAVTLVHRGKWLLNRQLDERAGAVLRKQMEEKNIRFALASEVISFEGDDVVTQAILNTGEVLDCDLAVIATGITPNNLLGIVGGLETHRGICVDDYLATSDANISALGECCEHRGQTFGLVEPIWHQCATLAKKLSANILVPFVNPRVATKLKVSGVQLLSAGDHITTERHREIIMEDKRLGSYRKLLLIDNKIVGIVLVGDTRSGQDYFELMQRGVVVSSAITTLIFGKVFFDFDALIASSLSSVQQPQQALSA